MEDDDYAHANTVSRVASRHMHRDSSLYNPAYSKTLSGTGLLP